MKLKKGEVEKALKKGKTIFIEGSNITEKRLYRFNNKLNFIEYSDDNKIWNESNMKIEDFENNEWIIFEE